MQLKQRKHEFYSCPGTVQLCWLLTTTIRMCVSVEVKHAFCFLYQCSAFYMLGFHYTHALDMCQ